MVLDCAAANSLFELGFGSSAVIAILSEKVRMARSRFFSKYLDAMKAYKPDLDRKAIDTLEVHDFILKGMPNLSWFFKFANVMQIIAGFLAIASIGTLLQLAYWGASCKVESMLLVFYCLTAFLFLPLFSWGYSVLLDMSIKLAIERTIPISVKFITEMVSNQQIRTKILKLIEEQVDLMSKINNATLRNEPAQQFNIRLDELKCELSSMHSLMNSSFANVHDEFSKVI